MKSLITFILLLLASIAAHAQTGIDLLEMRLVKGDKKALKDIAMYLDSTREQNDHLDWHRFTTPLNSIAYRSIRESFYFTDDEFTSKKIPSSKEFLAFVNNNYDKIHYVREAGTFVLTPFEKRTVDYTIREMSKEKLRTIKENRPRFLEETFLKEEGITALVDSRDPKSLLMIAYTLQRTRERFHSYSWLEEKRSTELTDIVALLTGLEIGVRSGEGNYLFDLEYDFKEGRALYLTYWINHYKDYKWDEKQQRFVNTKDKIAPIAAEAELFHLLASKNDSIAMNAFITLTERDPSIVSSFADEMDIGYTGHNYSLPTFPLRFLKVLSSLTDHCRKNNIDHKGTPRVKRWIGKLDSDLSFKDRYTLENTVIDSITLAEITSFEYWSLVYENGFTLTYSAGRILDKFYSQHWSEIVSDDKQLDLYTRKCSWYDRLGIIGSCNRFKVKFYDASPEVKQKLSAMLNASKEELINAEVITILNMIENKKAYASPSDKMNQANYDTLVPDLEKQLKNALRSGGDEERSRKVKKLLSYTTYAQLPMALDLCKSIPVKYEFDRYGWLSNDFGFPVHDSTGIEQFIKNYRAMNEYELYAHYADQLGLKYKKADGSLDPSAVYDMLKYDVADAFAGGGGGRRDEGVYLIIKLLELTYKTTLGYPKKQCNSGGIWGCDCSERSRDWMIYLEANKLVDPKKEPVSFSWEDTQK